VNFVNIFSDFQCLPLSIRLSALFLNLYFKIPKSANLNHYFNFAFNPEHGRHATLQALSLSNSLYRKYRQPLTYFNFTISTSIFLNPVSITLSKHAKSFFFCLISLTLTFNRKASPGLHHSPHFLPHFYRLSNPDSTSLFTVLPISLL